MDADTLPMPGIDVMAPEVAPAVTTTPDSIPGFYGPGSHLTPEQLEALADIPPSLQPALAPAPEPQETHLDNLD